MTFNLDENEDITEVNENQGIEETTQPNPQTQGVESNISAFEKYISVPRQTLVEPPKTEKEEPETPETEEGDNLEETPEDNSQAVSLEDMGISADLIVETEDFIIPELMARISPDEEAEPEDYSLDPDDAEDDKDAKKRQKRRDVLVKSWERFLVDKKVNATPTQQLVFAHIGAFGGPLILEGVHRLFDYLDTKKKEREEAKQKQEEIVQAQEENNQVSMLLKEIEGLKKQIAKPQPTTQKPETEIVAEEGPSEKDVVQPNTDILGNEYNDEPKKLTPIDQIKNDQEEEHEPETIKQGEFHKHCENPECNDTFIQGQGFAKKKKSAYYDKTCSIECMHKLIGSKGGRPKGSKNKK